MLQEKRNIIATEVEKLLVRSADSVANKQWLYEADKDIYGLLSDLYAKILTLTKLGA